MNCREDAPAYHCGDMINVRTVTCSDEVSHYTLATNVISGAGMSGATGNGDTHDNCGDGSTMWLAHIAADEKAWIQFDFGGTFPVKAMWIWNYNQYHPPYSRLPARGLKNVSIEYSIDGEKWQSLRGPGYPYQLKQADGANQIHATNLNDGRNSPIDFGNVHARFVRIAANGGPNDGNWGGVDGNEPYYGLSAVRFYMGSGLAVEPAEDWTTIFHRTSGWTGADGIYAISMDGDDFPHESTTNKTVFLFGDTFIGDVDIATDCRLGTTMINNSLAVLDGATPHDSAIEFIWNKGQNGQSMSVFAPTTEVSQRYEGTYYWLQDGVVLNHKLYCFPMLIGPNPDGPEGFQFAVHGVTRVSVPLHGQSLLFENQVQVDTPLFFKASSGTATTYFGAAILANTHEARALNPDGYIYVYGLQNGEQTKLVAARVQADSFENFSEWRYWNGESWSAEPRQATPIAEYVSSELSVSQMRGGNLDGKFIVVFQRDRLVTLYIGESPIGPFGEGIPLYYCDEPDGGNGIYVYNAKGHPHLSQPGELLVSYNVNTTSWSAHMSHAEIYRPRFIRVRQV